MPVQMDHRVTKSCLYIIRRLKSLPSEDGKAHLHNTQCMRRCVSLRCMRDLPLTSTYDGKLPPLNEHPKPK